MGSERNTRTPFSSCNPGSSAATGAGFGSAAGLDPSVGMALAPAALVCIGACSLVCASLEHASKLHETKSEQLSRRFLFIEQILPGAPDTPPTWHPGTGSFNVRPRPEG